MKKIFLLFLLAISFSACEKDDICIDETTPRLVLEFYDDASPANTKNVTGLKIKGEGAIGDLVLGTFSGVSKIYLPLKTNDDITKYSLILNSASTNPLVINEDFLQFNYTRENFYVSRACGYKTIFELLSFPAGVIQTEPETPDLPWIRSYSIQTTNIETENEVHIKIYF
ncbi:DUF6452 family protein [Flavobacterium sp.]|uniref:DUF6452 family protein n=1 Tax=Flavobacterium sp. TaxID=239 RepID=UPI0039194769